jgi:hypothetical protein
MPRDGALVGLDEENRFIPWLAKRDENRRRTQHHVARKAARKLAPHLDQLAARIFNRLDELKVSANIRCDCPASYSLIVPWLTDAINYPWLMLDSEHARTGILIDVDHPDARERALYLAAHFNLPMPTIVADPYTGRSHVFWSLATPVLITNGRAKPRRLFEVAGQLLAAAMGGTLLSHGALAKNPWGQATRLKGGLLHRDGPPATPAVWEAYEASGSPLCWVTHPGDLVGVELTAIVQALAVAEERFSDPTAVTSRRKQPAPSGVRTDGRNCAVFEVVRLWAYPLCERDEVAIRAEAAAVNRSLPNPMGEREAAGIARSIAKFMRERFGKGGYGRGKTANSETQAKRGRQSRASVAAKNREILLRAAEMLRKSGTKPTQRAVAKAAGLSIHTVRAHWVQL